MRFYKGAEEAERINWKGPRYCHGRQVFDLHRILSAGGWTNTSKSEAMRHNRGARAMGVNPGWPEWRVSRQRSMYCGAHQAPASALATCTGISKALARCSHGHVFLYIFKTLLVEPQSWRPTSPSPWLPFHVTHPTSSCVWWHWNFYGYFWDMAKGSWVGDPSRLGWVSAVHGHFLT